MTEPEHSLPKNYCPDCGPAGISHGMEKFSTQFDPVVAFIGKPIEAIRVAIRPGLYALHYERAFPVIYRALAAMRIGTIHDKPDKKSTMRTKVVWEEAMRRGITMKEFRLFGLSRELFWISFTPPQKDRAATSTIIRAFDGMPRPQNASDTSLVWMDNKGILMKKFGAVGIPVPRGGTCRTLSQAKHIFDMIDGPVIVKPDLGSRSRHTYIGITTFESLEYAFKKAKQLTPSPVVQEELQGFVFRITLVNGTIAGVMRREAPHVIGDGVHTIRELVAMENQNPLRNGPVFHTLSLDDTAITTLKEQHLSIESRIPSGTMAILHPKVRRNYGASTTEFEIDTIHPDNHALFLHIGTVLNAAFVGIDFMIEDITRSWREQKKCGVIECNSLPFIDLHSYPLRGTPKNVAATIWDLALPESKRA